MQVEGQQPGGMVGDDRLVDVHGCLRPPGGAAGEVQERGIFGSGGPDLECRRRRAHQRAEVERAGGQLSRLIAHEEHVLEPLQAAPDPGDLLPVEALRGDEHFRPADRDPGPQRLGAEGREQRREHGPGLERAESRDHEFRHAAQAGEDAVSRRHAELPQQIGEPARRPREPGERDVPARARERQTAERHMRAATGPHVPIDRLVGDVQPAAAGKAVERRAGLRPRKLSPCPMVVGHVRRHRRRDIESHGRNTSRGPSMPASTKRRLIIGSRKRGGK